MGGKHGNNKIPSRDRSLLEIDPFTRSLPFAYHLRCSTLYIFCRVTKQKKLPFDHIELPLCSFDIDLDEFIESPPFAKLSDGLKKALIPDKGQGEKIFFEVYRKTAGAPAYFPSYDKFRTFFKSLLEAVSTVNALGFAHFDVKRFNLRMANDGTAILCDFGASVKVSPKGGGITSYRRYHARFLPPETNLKYWNMKTTRPDEIDAFSVGVLIIDYLYYPCTLMSAYPFGRGNRAWQNSDYARRVFDMFGRSNLKSDGRDVKSLFVHKELFSALSITREESVRGVRGIEAGGGVWDPLKELENQLRYREDNKKLCTPFDRQDTTVEKFGLERDEKMDRVIVDLALKLLEPEPQFRWTSQEALQHEFFNMELP